MNTRLLGCVVLLGAALPAFGQGRDTAFAVHKLFEQRRKGSEAWAATGAKVAADESIGWRSATRSAPQNATVAAVNGGVPLAVGLLQAQRFSPEREAGILKSYAEGWPIPADIRRKLRRKHFHRTAHDVLPAN